MMRFSAAGASHVGLVREGNEDSGFAGPTCLLVADGVGGAAAGEVASATTAYVVSASVLAEPGADPLRVLGSATRLAQEQVRLGVREDPRRAGMATTMTAVVTDGTRFALAHVGDSRGYLFRDGTLEQLTADHTFVQQLVDDGNLTPEGARSHPWRHVVLRSIDGNPHETGDLTVLDLRLGDRVLLASDGLSDLVSREQVATVLARHGDQDAVDLLVQAALAAGGRDNVTCVLGTVVPGDDLAVGDGLLLGAARDPRIVVDPAVVGLPRSA